MRRILAERITAEGTFFLVDWYPSWQTQGHIKKAIKMLNEWEKNKDEDTLTHRGDIVLKSTNSTQDENDELVRQMVENTADHFLAYMGRGKSGSHNMSPQDVATRLFDEKDWAFVNGQEGAACDIAKANDEANPTAAEVMRRTYIAMRGMHRRPVPSNKLRYGAMQVRFMGEVDGEMVGVGGERPRPQASAQSLMQPLFADAIARLDVEKWKKGDLDGQVQVLKPAMAAVATSAPYLLRNPLSMMFVRFFFGSNELEKLLGGVEIFMKKGWEEMTRSVFLHEYLSVFGSWEKRTVDQVQLSYLHARALLTDAGAPEGEKGEEGAEGKEGKESAE
jgi:hypothetical protein